MDLRLSDIAFAEALARVEAHLELAIAINAAGNARQALIHASRPMIELMPRLSRELWDAPDIATELNRSVGAIASGIRTGAKPADLRRAADNVRSVNGRAIATVVGTGHEDGPFVASVVVALLRTAALANRSRTHDTEHTIRYGRADAVAYVARARHMCAAPWAGDALGERLDEMFTGLQQHLGSEEMDAPESFDAAVASMAELLHSNAGALLVQEPGLADFLDKVVQLLGEVETAYGAGDAFRADKLAAVAYVENYATVRDDLTALDPAAARTLETVLTDLRLRMRAGAGPQEIAGLADRGRSALALLQRVTGD